MRVRLGVLFLLGMAIGASITNWLSESKKDDDPVQPPVISQPIISAPIANIPVLPTPESKVDQPWGHWDDKPKPVEKDQAWGWKVPSMTTDKKTTWGWEMPAQQPNWQQKEPASP